MFGWMIWLSIILNTLGAAQSGTTYEGNGGVDESVYGVETTISTTGEWNNEIGG